MQENLRKTSITLKLTDTGRKNFLFITYSSDSVGLQNFIEIQSIHVNCCAGLIWNDDAMGTGNLHDQG
jgi:hypothetical protein